MTFYLIQRQMYMGLWFTWTTPEVKIFEEVHS